MRGGRARAGGWLGTALFVAAVLGAPVAASGQDLADLDYEHLEFRGVGFEVGYLFPTRVERTPTYAVRFDLGYLGPGLRIVPSFTYWSAPMLDSEVTTLERRLASLVARATGNPPPQVDLGVIQWTDYSLGLDAHIVWAMPLNLISFAGLGVSAHVLDGSGAAIEGTFIEDLLDSVGAGFNLHMGLEYPITDWFRVQGQGRYAVIPDMQFFHLGLSGKFLWGSLVPGEERRR
jgi:hypothetical protein